MLRILPTEISLSVLSYLPLPTLCSLPTLSRQWLDFCSENQSAIFHNAAILHEFIQPKTTQLEDALSAYVGSPWDGVTDWKDFCKSTPSNGLTDLFHPYAYETLGYRLIAAPENTDLIFVGRRFCQLRRNWAGTGRVVARLVTPPGSDVHRIKVDEKAGICITTRMFGGLAVTHLFSGVLLWSLPPVREPLNRPPTLPHPVVYSTTSRTMLRA